MDDCTFTVYLKSIMWEVKSGITADVKNLNGLRIRIQEFSGHIDCQLTAGVDNRLFYVIYTLQTQLKPQGGNIWVCLKGIGPELETEKTALAVVTRKASGSCFAPLAQLKSGLIACCQNSS